MHARDIAEQLLPIADSADRRFLTVYINVDQSRAENLNRKYEVAVEDAFRKAEGGIADGSERELFEKNVQLVQGFLKEYSPKGKSLLLVSDYANEVFRDFTLAVGLPTEAHWSSRPYVRPLVAARDEYENRLAAMVDRGRARIFAIRFNEIEDESDLLATEDVHHFDASGKDTMWSQMQYQRKAEGHALHHYKKVAEKLAKLMELGPYEGIILGGNEESVNALREQLPDELKKRTFGVFSTSFEAPRKEILEESHRVAKESERKLEDTLVEELVTRQAKNGAATAGLRDTVEAVIRGRIHQLVLAEDYTASEADFSEAKGLLTDAASAGPEGLRFWPAMDHIRTPEDLVEGLVEAVLLTNGEVETVREAAAEKLYESTGGVGAILRY